MDVRSTNECVFNLSKSHYTELNSAVIARAQSKGSIAAVQLAQHWQFSCTIGGEYVHRQHSLNPTLLLSGWDATKQRMLQNAGIHLECEFF
jgi:hypothetical protein